MIDVRGWPTRSTLLSLGAALAVNLTLRTLELRQKLVTSYFPGWGEVLAHPWDALLPVEIPGGHTRWSTTGLLVLAPLETALGAAPAFLLMNALLVIGAFAAAWWATRNARFSLAVGWCAALTTQFHWAYLNGAVTIFYLGALYAAWNMAALALVVRHPVRPTVSPRIVFVLSLLLLALWWEQWLDYWLSAMVACGFLLLVIRRHPEAGLSRSGAMFAVRTMAVTVALYLVVKLHYAGEHVRPGTESEVITNYLFRDGLSPRAGMTLASEDAISSVFTYTWLALTNYLPPALLPGRSLDLLGASTIVATQHGYHAAMQDLVRYHHVFLWYYFAGAALALFAVFTWTVARRSLRTGDARATTATALAVLVWLGSATHWLIKYRPYLSEPLLHYKALMSIVGATGLLALGYSALMERMPPRRSRLVPGSALLLLLSAAYYRPAALNAMSNRLDMGSLPSPQAALDARSGVHDAILGARRAAYLIRWKLGLAAPPPIR